MITEDYVSFETAKLLKEKGFNEECEHLYADGKILSPNGIYNWNKGETLFANYKSECSAPTLQMAMKWLREVHNIFIEPGVDFDNDCKRWWAATIVSLKKNNIINEFSGYNSYEEACESAIKYCLENLI